MDTLGALIDKLFTVDMKMWNHQELFYKIRHMTFDQFKEQFYNEEGMLELWDQFKKAMDINIQRNQLIDEIDQKIVEMLEAAKRGENLSDGRYVQHKHKTY